MFDTDISNIRAVNVSVLHDQSVVAIRLSDDEQLDDVMESIELSVCVEIGQTNSLAQIKIAALERADHILQHEIGKARASISG